MYCKYCGKEISKDSVYCSSCGKKQDGRDSNLKSWIAKYKLYIILYAIWVVIHYALYLYGDSSGISGTGYFYPFTKHITDYDYYGNPLKNGIFDADYYDSTELLVYCVLIPLIIVLITWKWKSIVLVWKKIWNYNKLIVISYTVWLILNTIWWAISISYYPTERFFPFTSGGKGDPMFNLAYYDSSEFIVYCFLLPLILFLGIWIYKRKK